MLAPLRDYFLPNDPRSAPLLLTAKAQYFARLELTMGALRNGDAGFSEAQWIVPEQINGEHLLDVFTALDAESEDVWRAFHRYILHLIHLNPRPITLYQRVEMLPDSHPWKAACVYSLNDLSSAFRKRLWDYLLTEYAPTRHTRDDRR